MVSRALAHLLAHLTGPWIRLQRRVHQRLQQHTAHLSPSANAMLWAAGAGFLFSLLNGLMRSLTQQFDPFQAQFLRYGFGLVVLLPMLIKYGFARYKPQHIGGQFVRGGLHTLGLFLWFAALPKIPLADMTAIGFTTPLFIMLGAYLFLHEPMRWERWVATGLGFTGVMIVVGPQFAIGQGSGAGWYHLIMLASAPLFAASFLVTKALTRYESTGTILVWQGITISLLSLPFAASTWANPSLWQWLGFLLSGALGSGGHYCLTQAFRKADISATQSIKFLELVWSAMMGWVMFGDVPTLYAILGGTLISAATIWVARRESR